MSENREKCETSKTKSRSNITPGTTLQCSIVELMEFNWLKWRNDFFLWSNLLKNLCWWKLHQALNLWMMSMVDCACLSHWLTAMPARLASWLGFLFHSNFCVYFHSTQSIWLTLDICEAVIWFGCWMTGFVRGLNWFQLKI